MPKSLRELIDENAIVFVPTIDNSNHSSEIIFRILAIAQANPNKEIKLYISSFGGTYLNMMSIYDTIKAVKNPVAGYCIGNADQYAALLLAACNKGKRYILKHSEVSVWEPNGYLDVGANQETEIVIAAKEAKEERNTFEKLLAKETGQPVEKIHQDISTRLDLTAEEAVRYGFVDVILE